HRADVMLTLAEQQIHHPAATDMLARRAAMVQDIAIVAPGIFECIAENRHASEGTVVVDGLGQGDDVGGAPGGINSDRAEGIAEDIAEEGSFHKLCDRKSVSSSFTFSSLLGHTSCSAIPCPLFVPNLL